MAEAVVRRAALCCALALTVGAAHAAPEIDSGQRCGADGSCFTFGPGGLLPPAVARSLTFQAPSAGTAAVSVDGTMTCLNTSQLTGAEEGLVDLSAQILKTTPRLWRQVPAASGSTCGCRARSL